MPRRGRRAQPLTMPGATIRVVCDIDAHGADVEAVRAACARAGRQGHVALVCVAYVDDVQAATAALAQAMRQARGAGVQTSAYLLRRDRGLHPRLGARIASREPEGADDGLSDRER